MVVAASRQPVMASQHSPAYQSSVKKQMVVATPSC